MKTWVALLFSVASVAPLALGLPPEGERCPRVHLALDPRLTPTEVEANWATGQPIDASSAAIQLVSCEGEVLDTYGLDAPLARLDPTPLMGAPYLTWLVSVDLTAEAGAWSGPLTLPVEIVSQKLHPVDALVKSGNREPIRLTQTLRANWSRETLKGREDLLQVRSQPKGDGFETLYWRFSPTPGGWKARVTNRDGMWESDAEFPNTSLFPRGRWRP